MLGEEFGHLGLDRLGQQGARSVAQHLGKRVGERPWLKQLDDVSIGHGVSLLCWRSGGANTPTIRRLIPSARHQLSRIAPLASANPFWIAAAMLIYAVNLTLRAWRWQVILRPVATIPYPMVARALLVGYGLNVIMPARLGELFRAEFFKKAYGLSRVWGLASVVIVRLFDGITVICCLGVGLLLAAAARPNAGLLINVLVMGSVLFGAVLLAALYL